MVKKILVGILILSGIVILARPYIPTFLDTLDILSGRGTVNNNVYKNLPDYFSVTSNWKIYTTGKFSLKLPPSWKGVDFLQDPLGKHCCSIQSPDFKSEVGFSHISAGSIITINDIDENLTNMSLEQRAKFEGNANATILDYFKTNDLTAVKFTHSCCEDQNNVEGIIFLRNKTMYKIEQDYHKGESNPYQNLLEQILSTVVFK